MTDEDVDASAVELAGYPRQDRCVLRYRFDEASRGRCVYGKVYADNTGVHALSVLAAVHARLAYTRGAVPLQVPKPLGYDPGLRLALTASLPGDATSLGDRGQRERLVTTAGVVAAVLHDIGPRLSRRRTVSGELARLHGEVAALSGIWPDVAADCDRWLRRLRGVAAATFALPPRFGHGDLTPAQFLFAGPAVAVVDFDDAAVAEPALDLGRFLAHLRLGLARHLAEGDADRLGPVLISAYCEASGGGHAARRNAGLVSRVALCSSLSLLGSALRACRQLKDTRVALALAALSKEAACLS